MLKGSALLFLFLGLLVGCGSSKKVVTLPAYGDHPAATVTTPDDPAACRSDANEFATQSRAYLAHSGTQAAYPADLWYVILREALTDFRGRGCDPAILGRAIGRSLTAKQRATLLADLPTTMAASVRGALGAA